mgnify:CR=1 FL=1
MKRKKLTWLFCLFFAAFFFLVPAVAHASAKDDIGKYDVTVNILKNGDAKVTHEITYNLSKKRPSTDASSKHQRNRRRLCGQRFRRLRIKKNFG